jgi:hypothetical protein
MPWSTAASSSGDGQLRVMGLRMMVRSLGSVRMNVVGGRPIDPAIFDDYCNRIGRKSTLIAHTDADAYRYTSSSLRPKPGVGWHPG